ncbi:hypothetical protein [Komagataeibacter xylinus]|uniref:Uncharacterized protein n=1 Tax=Komagataeibacter xylinus TaxID=28448 RepID=A0A857FPE3_KOMXY|nr:hypothetical protein [Komagataeibacter xylinus]QHC35389.1 hypothetical protein FMA36_07620 [Komagataeibacter xylinus]
MTNEMKTETPMYLVPGKVTPEVEHRAANVVFDMYGREILWPVFHAYMTAIASPVQPCADIETVCVSLPTLYDNLKDFDRAQVFPVSLRSANGMDIELVRRADMEAHVAHLSVEIARLRVVEAEMHLLEEVCAFYTNDEDRFIKADGNAEPYGMIPTDVGMKARSARARFMAREQAAQEAGGEA